MQHDALSVLDRRHTSTWHSAHQMCVQNRILLHEYEVKECPIITKAFIYACPLSLCIVVFFYSSSYIAAQSSVSLASGSIALATQTIHDSWTQITSIFSWKNENALGNDENAFLSRAEKKSDTIASFITQGFQLLFSRHTSTKHLLITYISLWGILCIAIHFVFYMYFQYIDTARVIRNAQIVKMLTIDIPSIPCETLAFDNIYYSNNVIASDASTLRRIRNISSTVNQPAFITSAVSRGFKGNSSSTSNK
jgi:hypothetical protein